MIKAKETILNLRLAEAELLLKALDKLEDADKSNVTYHNLRKQITFIKDVWKNQEKVRTKAKTVQKKTKK